VKNWRNVPDVGGGSSFTSTRKRSNLAKNRWQLLLLYACSFRSLVEQSPTDDEDGPR
jgi:hypothetical protein